MLPLSLIFITTFLCLLVYKVQATPTSPRFSMEPKAHFFSYLLSIVGIGLVFINGNKVYQGLLQKEWPTVQCIITSVGVVGGTAYVPEVVYSYKVGKNEYSKKTDLKVPYFGPKSSRKEVAYKTIYDYPKEGKKNVYYNPRNPHESCLKPGATWAEYSRLSLGTMLYGVGAFGLIRIWLA